MHARGFTLIELLLALALLAVLATWAWPATADMLALLRLHSATQAYAQAVYFARQAALSHGTVVRLCPSQNGKTCTPDSPYHAGWIVLQEDSGAPGAALAPESRVLQDRKAWDSLEITSNQSGNTGLLFLPNGTPAPGFFGMTVRFSARTQARCVVLARSARIRYAGC